MFGEQFLKLKYSRNNFVYNNKRRMTRLENLRTLWDSLCLFADEDQFRNIFSGRSRP